MYQNQQRNVKKLDLQNYIQFLGSIPHDELWKYFNIADVFILLNDLTNLCNPLLEAMYYKKCIITLNVGGIGELVRDGENGILLENNQLNIVSAKIVELLKNDELRNRLGENAGNTAEKHFNTKEHRMDKEITVVENLISSSVSSPLKGEE